MKNTLTLQAAVFCLLTFISISGANANTIANAIADGELDLDMRYRYEFVDQEGFDKNAYANTVRLRLGWTTAEWNGLYAAAVFDGNWSIGSEHYNSTSNGRTEYPVIADPEDQQINKGYIAYRGPRKLHALVGRQTINLDNQRFVGSVAFRQLEQRFDNLRISINPFDGNKSEALSTLNLDYMYADRVYRVFGEHNPNKNLAEQNIDAHFFNASTKFSGYHASAYYYATKFQDQPPSPALNFFLSSNQIFGARVSGKPEITESLKVPFQLEYANQSDYANAPGSYSVHYVRLEAGLASKHVTGKLGVEQLGSDNGERGFQTPFATLHKFNGWADVFLSTPPDGLRDIYGLVQGKVQDVNLVAVVHVFTAESGGQDYGKELDLRAWRKFGIYHVELKYADYRSDFDDPRMPGDPQAVGDKRVFWFTLGLAL